MTKPHTECNECEKVRECYLGVCVDCNGTDGQGAMWEWFDAKEAYHKERVAEFIANAEVVTEW